MGHTSEGIGALGSPPPSSTHSPVPALQGTASRQTPPNSQWHPLSLHSSLRRKPCQTCASCHCAPRSAVSAKEPRPHVPDTGSTFPSSFGVLLQGDSVPHRQALSLGTWQDLGQGSQKLPQGQALAETRAATNRTARAHFKTQELLEQLVLGILQINGPGATQEDQPAER